MACSDLDIQNIYHYWQSFDTERYKIYKNVRYLSRFRGRHKPLQNSLLFTNSTEHKFMFTAVDRILFHNVMKGVVSTSPSQMLVPAEPCQRTVANCKDSIKEKTAFCT
jgi:hypothetical protein